MKFKTSELTGTALDWAAAKCEGYEMEREKDGQMRRTANDRILVGLQPESTRRYEYSPSTNWAQGGLIIERECISVDYRRAEFKDLWIAYKLGRPLEDNPQGGPTPLIAAMRCYVASKLCDEVDVPAELSPAFPE